MGRATNWSRSGLRGPARSLVVFEELTLVGGAFKFQAVADGPDCPGAEGPVPVSSKLLLGMRSGFEWLVTGKGDVSTRGTEVAVR